MYWFLMPLVGFLMFFFFQNTYTEFEPTIYSNDSFKKIEVDTTFYKNLILVFDSDYVEYKTNKSGMPLIKRKLATDKEWLYHYTKEALNSSRLNSNKHY